MEKDVNTSPDMGDEVASLNSPQELGLEPVRHERFAERVYESLFHAIKTGIARTGRRGTRHESRGAAFFGVLERSVAREQIPRP